MNVIEPRPLSLPAILRNETQTSIHKRMLTNVPRGVDITEGGFVFDMTKPTSIELSRFIHFYFAEFIKVMYPQWSYTDYLDQHAAQEKVYRKDANAAFGEITITGTPGIVIPSGEVFAVPSIGRASSIEFATLAESTIPPAGSVTVDVQAVKQGVAGNVEPNSITVMARPMNGIVSITNALATTGGSEIETDKMLRGRLLEKLAAKDLMYIGNDSDHKRWAEEVPGVGYADVHSLWNGPSTVKINLLDSNGQPANEQLVEEVYNHIMSPDDPMQRLAPPGEVLTVRAPSLLTFNYTFDLSMETGYELVGLEELIRVYLNEYYKEAKNNNLLVWAEVFGEIIKTPGVADLRNLTINGQTENIEFTSDEYPVTGTMTIGVIPDGP